MITCCVPSCYTNSRKCDVGVSFHEFPSSPDAAAKWIKNINTVVKNGGMWFPQDKSFICSKHFLPCDFKPEHKIPSLKPRSVPTVFENIGTGRNSLKQSYKKRKNEDTKSPLIVKIIKHPDNECEREMGKEIFYSPSTCDIENLSTSEVSESSTNKETDLVISNVRSLSDLVIKPSNASAKHPRNIQTLQKYGGSNENVQSLLRNYSNQPQFSQQNTNLFSNTVENMRENLKQKLGSNKDYVAHTTVNQHAKKKVAINKKNDSRVHKNSKQLSPELIEIGPDTFLKINPEVIKVTKKVTPSGNTVLQFVMNQSLAFNQKDNFLPTLVTKSNSSQSDSATSSQYSKIQMQSKEQSQLANLEVNNDLDLNNINNNLSENKNVEHVVGHLVDTHICKERCNLAENHDSELSLSPDLNRSTEVNNEKNSVLTNTVSTENTVNKKSDLAESECIANAPVLMTTNLPVCHYFTEKQKLMSQLKQKTRQISSIRVKLNRLLKKTEELENKCIVQERQLSYAHLKALKMIKKNAARGDANAMYILEQIRAYSGKTKMRWSESTLRQCSIWCRKAPYAYEYFRKADLFKLPCVGTVKRYMKSNPAIKSQVKNSNGDPDAEESSSDFDFDDSDSNESNIDGNENNAEWNEVSGVTCKRSINQSSEVTRGNQTFAATDALDESGQNNLCEEPEETQCIQKVNTKNSETVLSRQVLNGKVKEIDAVELSAINVENFKTSANVLPLKDTSTEEPTAETETVSTSVPEEANSVNLNVQEIIFQSGEIVQCLNSKLGNGHDIENQYYIIPTMNDQPILTDHQYSVVQSHTVPLVIQNIESEQLPLEQHKQIIFIAENSEQPECSSTDLMSST